jgi:tetratricopeptide (TPR) repeat protein
MDYLEYAYLQTGQDTKAKQVVDELLSYRQSAPANLPMAYAVSAIPVRYALERRDWHAAAMLSEPSIGFPLQQFPWGEAIIKFARALGEAQTGDLTGAQAEIDKLQVLKEQLLQAKDNYWANQVEVQRLGASAVLAYAQGDKESAIKLARAAADLDATMDKHPATPAEVLPARELLADLLLQSGNPGAALKEYGQALQGDPNRFRSLLGKARAAEQSGDTAMAKVAYQKLLALSGQADADMPELAEAKAFLAKNI